MTDFNNTPADAPRIPVGTRVRYTERGDAPSGHKWYKGLADGEGTVTADDGTNEAPYNVRLDRSYPNAIIPMIPDDSVLADYNELEILP